LLIDTLEGLAMNGPFRGNFFEEHQRLEKNIGFVVSENISASAEIEEPVTGCSFTSIRLLRKQGGEIVPNDSASARKSPTVSPLADGD
jgi:hypothetical protein